MVLPTTTITTTISSSAPGSAQLPSRRGWLKGLGAMLGTGLLAAPSRLLAQPSAAPAAASALVGGDEYIGMVKLLTGSTVPQGWALCDGRVLPTAEHPALFAVLRHTYGGDGRRTFALPDLRADMAALATLEASRPAGAVPVGQLCAIKVANAPALAVAATELRLHHLCRPRPERG